MTWQAILVDDERLARAELRTLLGAHDGVEIVGEASTVAAAAEQVRLTGATLVFLDIMLKGESGFDLLPRLPEDIAVVFVTAYDRFAVQAFEVHALDYLLKPVSPARLAAALERLGRRPGPSGTAAPAARGGEEPESDFEPLAWTGRLFLRLDDHLGFLAVAQIRAVLADGDQAIVLTVDGRRRRVRKPLREWVARLPGQHFLQIHRGVLVNLHEIQRVEEWSHGSFHVYLRQESTPLVMSRRFATRLRARLG